MNVGFTGTQKGWTKEQKDSFYRIIDKHDFLIKPKYWTSFHHGDCIGADWQAHFLIDLMKVPIVIHPPIKEDKRAFCQHYTEIRKQKEYLARNKDIVNETDVLIATPKEDKEIVRSGTWSTVRYARKKGKRIIIIYPDGMVSDVISSKVME
jgi:hypothetical protein